MNALNTLMNNGQMKTLDALMAKPLKTVSDFDLLDFGVPGVQMQVVKRLQDTAYSEIASLLNRAPARDDIPVNDRGQSLSEYDDEYQGEDRPKSHEMELQEAVLAGAMVHRFAQHLASIKGGGAEWAINGFETSPEWVPVDPKDEFIVALCAKKGHELNALIANADPRIKIKIGMVLPSIVSFGEWLHNALSKEMQRETASAWGTKLATALRIADDEVKGLTSIGIDTTKAAIGHWADGCAFNRKTSRLHDALVSAADAKWKFNYEQVILNSEKLRISANNELLLCYSPAFAAARAEFAGSDDLFNSIHDTFTQAIHGLLNNEPLTVAKAEKLQTHIWGWASEEMQRVLNDTEARGDYTYALAVQQAKKDQQARDREVLRNDNLLLIKEQVVGVALAKRESDKRAAEQAARMAELDALLNPVAPKPATKKTVKTSTKKTVKK